MPNTNKGRSQHAGAGQLRYLSGAAIPIDGGMLAGFGYPLLEKL